MKKTSLKENIQIINKLGNRVPKSINEAINFEGFEDDNEMGVEDEPMEEPTMEPSNNNSMDDGIDVENFINETRKRALKIMAKLADTPENPIYDLSKRIWQICDKAYNDQKEQQQGQQGQNPMQNTQSHI